MSKVSIVVPTYNQASYVEATLDHILHQDYEDLEIIVTDDASTDGTAQLLQEYVRLAFVEEVSYASRYEGATGVVERCVHERYPQNRRIRLLLNRENVGASENYNRGLQEAAGDYCTFIAGDDLPHPCMITTLVDALERNEADFAYSDMFIVDDQMQVLRRFSLPDYDYERSLCDWYLLGVSKLYRREWHARVGTFDPMVRVANDYDLYLRFAMAGAKFVHVPRVLYSVRYHGPDRKVGQHSPDSERQMFEESIEIAMRARRFLADGNCVPLTLEAKRI